MLHNLATTSKVLFIKGNFFHDLSVRYTERIPSKNTLSFVEFNHVLFIDKVVLAVHWYSAELNPSVSSRSLPQCISIQPLTYSNEKWQRYCVLDYVLSWPPCSTFLLGPSIKTCEPDTFRTTWKHTKVTAIQDFRSHLGG